MLTSLTCKATEPDFVIIEADHDDDKEELVLSHLNLTSIARKSFENSHSVSVKQPHLKVDRLKIYIVTT